MRIYKPGDKVRILKTEDYLGRDMCHLYSVGDICEAKYGTDSDGDTAVYTRDGHDYYCFAPTAIAPATPSWDSLSEGDVLVNDDRDYDRIVQGVIGKIVLWIDENDNSGYTSIDELKGYGWKIKDAESDDITEVTLEQVADKLGISVDKLRIKD